MSKKVKISIIIVLLFIILITSINTIIHIIQRKNVEKFLEYVSSKEIDSDVKSPEKMHMILGVYKGEADSLNILKSITYFKNTTIQEIQKNCKNGLKTRWYYNNHKTQMKKQLGIENYQEFKRLAEQCSKFNGNNEIDYMNFDGDNINRDNNGVTCKLYIKFKNSEEMVFNVQVLNRADSSQTSVIIK